jgi:hypothetical protein
MTRKLLTTVLHMQTFSFPIFLLDRYRYRTEPERYYLYTDTVPTPTGPGDLLC